jgi:uncharacterized protein with HEPN domain
LPFRDEQTHLRDIPESIDHVNAFIEGFDLLAYEADRKTRSAVERELQIITEAAIRLGPSADTICPGPDWIGFRGMGNVLRHAYHRIDNEIIWNTVHDELPPLRKAVIAALSKTLEDLTT